MICLFHLDNDYIGRIKALLYIQKAYYTNKASGMRIEDIYHLVQGGEEMYAGVPPNGHVFYRICNHDFHGGERPDYMPNPACRSYMFWGDEFPQCPAMFAAWNNLRNMRRGPWFILPMIGWLL